MNQSFKVYFQIRHRVAKQKDSLFSKKIDRAIMEAADKYLAEDYGTRFWNEWLLGNPEFYSKDILNEIGKITTTKYKDLHYEDVRFTDYDLAPETIHHGVREWKIDFIGITAEYTCVAITGHTFAVYSEKDGKIHFIEVDDYHVKAYVNS